MKVGVHMAVSIRDVAKAAGVSVSTVSRALNGYSDVNKETQQKIQKTVKALGYQPNQSAKNLASKKQKSLAIIASDMVHEDNKAGTITGNMLSGAYRYLNGMGSTAALYGIDSQMQKQKSFEDFCDCYSISGAVILGLKVDDPYMKEVGKSKIPCVGIDVAFEGENGATIATDEEAAFEAITSYVIGKGHRKLALLKGYSEAQITYKRYAGFLKALKKHKIPEENVTVLLGKFTQQDTYEAVKQYIQENGKDGATVFLCMSDMMAIGTVRAIQECGYKIPDDFSVTGFDGLGILNFIHPGITTIDQNIAGKGYIGMKMLQEMVQGEANYTTLYVPYTIVERESVKTL